MNIWLDWFAARRVQEYRAAEARAGRECTLEDSKIFRDYITEGKNAWKSAAVQCDTSSRSEMAYFADLVAPVIGEGDNPASPLGIRIDQAPAFERPADYSDGEVVAEGQRILSHYSIVYLDLGERVFMMAGGIFLVRALFVRREGSINRFCAVITRPGTNKGWRLAWCEGRHERDPKDSDYDDVWALASTDIHDPYRPINFRKIDYACLADVESLFWLTLICWRHLDHNALPPMPALPLSPLTTEVLPLAWRDDDMVVGDGLSLFQMVRMPAIDEYRITIARQSFPRQSHKKCRHDVAGFPRWQACGKGLKERRRIWVPRHQRGSGPAKTRLHAMPAEPDPIDRR